MESEKAFCDVGPDGFKREKPSELRQNVTKGAPNNLEVLFLFGIECG
jgi:hypothetical protein